MWDARLGEEEGGGFHRDDEEGGYPLEQGGAVDPAHAPLQLLPFGSGRGLLRRDFREAGEVVNCRGEFVLRLGAEEVFSAGVLSVLSGPDLECIREINDGFETVSWLLLLLYIFLVNIFH